MKVIRKWLWLIVVVVVIVLCAIIVMSTLGTLVRLSTRIAVVESAYVKKAELPVPEPTQDLSSYLKEDPNDLFVKQTGLDKAKAELKQFVTETLASELVVGATAGTKTVFGDGGCLTADGKYYLLEADKSAIWMGDVLKDAITKGGVCDLVTYKSGYFWSVTGLITYTSFAWPSVSMSNGEAMLATPGLWQFRYFSPSEANGFVLRDNIPVAAPLAQPTAGPTIAGPQPTVTPMPTVITGTAVISGPVESFCQLGVTQLTSGVLKQNLFWDPVALRGYMDDQLSTQVWAGPAYCKTVFSSKVKLLFDSVAANPVIVDGKIVAAGNGRIESGTVFEWIYTFASRSNGHAFLIQP